MNKLIVYSYTCIISKIINCDLLIHRDEWSPGVWAGTEGMTIEIYSSDNLNYKGSAVVKSIDLNNRRITLDSIPNNSFSDDIIHIPEMSIIHEET